MAVVTTTSNKVKENEQNMKMKKNQKVVEKTRPITATLEHPLILDIKLLKKLDMTTFTKKGLIALSKFCGISLIKRTDSKIKFNKYIKTIQGSRKNLIKEINRTMMVEESIVAPIKKDKSEIKRRHLKPKVQKIKPKINYKSSDESSTPDEDSLDVICKKHDKPDKIKEPKKQTQRFIKENESRNGKIIMAEIFKSAMKDLVPEPCKTCNRSEHPERFHSHPKELTKSPEANEQITGKMEVEERLKNSPLTKAHVRESLERRRGKKSPSAKTCDYFPGKSSSLTDNNKTDSLSQKSPKSRFRSDFEAKSTSLIKTYESSSEIKENYLKIKSQNKSSSFPSPSKSGSSKDVSKSGTSRSGVDSQENLKSVPLSPENTLNYITGCYICGRPVSPKTRMKHEKNCILEWRTKNTLLSPDSRKPEPKRPDFRFTVDGTLDCKGTFESIWANHQDSLIPCKRCGRKFFPERIERHEKCCNNQPVKFNCKN